MISYALTHTRWLQRFWWWMQRNLIRHQTGANAAWWWLNGLWATDTNTWLSQNRLKSILDEYSGASSDDLYGRLNTKLMLTSVNHAKIYVCLCFWIQQSSGIQGVEERESRSSKKAGLVGHRMNGTSLTRDSACKTNSSATIYSNDNIISKSAKERSRRSVPLRRPGVRGSAGGGTVA